MEFLDKIVIPPSANHVLLVKYILTISFVLFIPYIGMVLGSSFLSVYFNRLGRSTGNPMFTRFAKDVIENSHSQRTLSLRLELSRCFQ